MSEPSLRNLDDYNVRAVAWLDKPFLQASAFILLAGRKGTIKGTLSCRLAALCTRGQLYPVPRRVLVVTSEDSVELDFLPRLLAADGNPALVEVVGGEFGLPDDVGWLHEQASRLGDVGLIVIDPLGNHTHGIDTDKEGAVRNAIAPLNKLADDLDCLVLGIRHLGKDASRGALASVLGSTAWVDVPRAVILMAADDEDDHLFHAQVVAGNRGPKNHGRVYRLELVDVPPAREITLAVSAGDSTKDVETLLAANSRDGVTSRSAAAREAILDLLEQNGCIESDTLDAQIAAEIGVAAKTVQNQRGRLKNLGLIQAHPEKDDTGQVLRWIVCRTTAPRTQIPTTTNPATETAKTSQIPSTSLESVSTGPGTPHPDSTERGPGPGPGDEPQTDQNDEPGTDPDEVERLADLARTYQETDG